MNRKKLLLFLLVVVSGFYLQVSGKPLLFKIIQSDPDKENQILYNGRIWHNLYSNIRGDQFLFTKDFLKGSVTMNGQSFKDIDLIYDIYNDEIITITNHSYLLQLNKEMVDSFSLIFKNETYRFLNTDADTIKGIKGYVNVLYKGKSALYVKYKKYIDLLVVDGKYDMFDQKNKIYFLKNGVVSQFSNKKELLKILLEDKTKIKDFIKKNKLRVSKKNPRSFIPVIRYYDSISQ